jgi:hypothetical protein
LAIVTGCAGTSGNIHAEHAEGKRRSQSRKQKLDWLLYGDDHGARNYKHSSTGCRCGLEAKGREEAGNEKAAGREAPPPPAELVNSLPMAEGCYLLAHDR